MQIKVIYEDNHLLVVEKPINMLVQEDQTSDPDLLTELKAYIKTKYNKPGNVFLSLVHRLDRPVGGVIVFAKTSKAAGRLSDQLRRRVIERKYLVVTRGVMKEKEGRLVDHLLKDHRRNYVSVVSNKVKGSKEARLTYKTIGIKNNLSLLEVKLETGRSHQIRVQLAHLGHPIYGDQKYGEELNQVGQQIALWAHELSFKHPTTKEVMTFKTDPPTVYPWDLY